MSTELDLSVIPKCKLTRTGALFDESTTFDEWVSVGKKLCLAEAASGWLIGDWINFGREQFQKRDERGRFCEPELASRYDIAIQVTTKARSTLKHYASVSALIPECRRRHAVDFSTHAEVAKLPPEDQVLWLDKAEKEGLQRSNIRAAIRLNYSTKSARESDGPSMKFAQGMPVKFLLEWLKKHNPEWWTSERREYWVAFLKPLVNWYNEVLVGK